MVVASSCSRRHRRCADLASSSALTRPSSAATRRLRAEAASLSALASFSCKSARSMACRFELLRSCSSCSRRSCTSAWCALLPCSRLAASPLFARSSSCKLSMRMFSSTFSRLACRRSSSSSASRELARVPATSSWAPWSASGAAVASENCFFNCSKIARWSSSVLRSPSRPKAPSSPPPTVGRAPGSKEGRGWVSMRERSSERNWSKELDRDSPPALDSSATCSLNEATCFLETSSSDSAAARRCRCCCSSTAARSELRSFSAITASFIFAVSNSPSTRIFSKRSSRSSARVDSSAWLRSSMAAFCARTRWYCT
mmetsp:Transcript_44580/g.129641  ORF Transcript_44580/g.129641 Transcript_44580/m.129641 type:complete len:315 (-) Transcript_44580:3049-3993(-)